MPVGSLLKIVPFSQHFFFRQAQVSYIFLIAVTLQEKYAMSFCR